MIQLLKRLFTIGDDSKNLAKSRLHFVLVQDRAGLSSEELAAFRKELVGVIEKYFVINENGFDINYKRDSDTTTLLINSPIVVRKAKRQGDQKKEQAKPATATA